MWHFAHQATVARTPAVALLLALWRLQAQAGMQQQQPAAQRGGYAREAVGMERTTMHRQHRESAAAKDCALCLQAAASTCCFPQLQASCCIQHDVVAHMCVPAQETMRGACLVTETKTTIGAGSTEHSRGARTESRAVASAFVHQHKRSVHQQRRSVHQHKRSVHQHKGGVHWHKWIHDSSGTTLLAWPRLTFTPRQPDLPERETSPHAMLLVLGQGPHQKAACQQRAAATYCCNLNP